MLNLLSVLIMSLGVSSLQANAPAQIVLTDVRHNVYRQNAYISSYNFTPDCNYPWYVMKTTLHGGKQEGVEVLEVHNGILTFEVIPTRGMSIQQVIMGNVRLGWDSPVEGIVNPSLVNLMERNGNGWLEGFTEWFVRCGLEYLGAPGKDQVTDDNGTQTQMDLTLHGKIANTPASLVEIIVDRDPPYRITIRGLVDEAFLHGPKFHLMTEISTVPGSSTFRISDTVTNGSSLEQEFGMLYHINYAMPFMEKDARFICPAKQVTPVNEHAAQDVSSYDIYRAPTVGFAEQTYFLTLWGDDANNTEVMLRNAAADKGVSMSFSLDELPFFTLWKNQAAIDDGYVTGLEPGTGYPLNRSAERQSGRVPVLAPHESRKFAMDFAVLNSKGLVQAAADRISKIKSARQTTIDNTPVTGGSQSTSQPEEPAR